MKLSLPKITWPMFTRNKNGDTYYDIRAIGDWTGALDNLTLAQNHPILTPAILFVAKLFSQAEFSMVDSSGNVRSRKNSLLELLNNPNPYQTRQDFLETLMFMMVAQGVGIVAKQTVIGFDEPRALHVLDKELITWPNGLDNKKWRRSSKAELDRMLIKYDIDNENLTYRLGDLMFFYDLPNALDRNPFEAKSRIDGLKQTLINTMDSMVAKNIILKSNGKEIVSAKKDGFPLTPEEKSDIESMFNDKMGLAFNRKRGVVTKSDVNWKSLHIALRDLGLDESTKVDGNIVYTALHIPKDILSLEAKKTTYNNFKESMVSYVQNEMQSSLAAVCAVFNKHFEYPTTRLAGNYEHLPIMQFILLERYDVALKRANALRALLTTGIPKEEALNICGFDSSLELNEMLPLTGQEQQDNTESNGGEENNEEEKRPFKVRRLG